MTQPFDDPDRSIAETIGDFQARLEEFQDGVQLIEPPLGTLLQQIALMRQLYSEAADRGATTEGELARLVPVVEEAMNVTEWLLGVGQ
jgi:hypothetical protein